MKKKILSIDSHELANRIMILSLLKDYFRKSISELGDTPDIQKILKKVNTLELELNKMQGYLFQSEEE